MPILQKFFLNLFNFVKYCYFEKSTVHFFSFCMFYASLCLSWRRNILEISLIMCIFLDNQASRFVTPFVYYIEIAILSTIIAIWLFHQIVQPSFICCVKALFMDESCPPKTRSGYRSLMRAQATGGHFGACLSDCSSYNKKRRRNSASSSRC